LPVLVVPAAARPVPRDDLPSAGPGAGPPPQDGCPVAVAGGGRCAPSAALARLVRTRAGTCGAPGCRIPAARCDVDHVVRHPDGPTCACNPSPLCRYHHRMKHERGWTLHRDGDGALRWTSPAGLEHSVPPRAVLPAPLLVVRPVRGSG
jgi:hypothetical protein